MFFFWGTVFVLLIELLLRVIKRERIIDYGYGLKREANKYIPSAPPIDYKLYFRLLNHPSHNQEFSLISTNNVGLRGQPMIWGPKPMAEVRVIILGDSLAADHFHSDEICFTSLLEQKLYNEKGNIKVYCACFGGETREDGLAMLVHRLVHLEPDLIIFMHGMGEIKAIVEGKKNYLSLHKDQYRDHWLGSFFFGIVTELEIVRTLLLIIQSIRRPLTKLELSKGVVFNSLDFLRWAQRKVKNPLSNTFDLSTLEKGLAHSTKIYSLMLDVCKASNIKTLSVIPPIRWQKQKVGEEDEDSFYFTQQGRIRIRQHMLYNVLEEFASKTRAICVRKKVTSIDLSQIFPKEQSYWIDDAHLSTLGIKTLVEEIAAALALLLV